MMVLKLMTLWLGKIKNKCHYGGPYVAYTVVPTWIDSSKL